MEPSRTEFRTPFGTALTAIAFAVLTVAACGVSGAPSQQALTSPGAGASGSTTPVALTAAPKLSASTPSATPAIARITPIPGAPDSGVVVELSTNGFAFSLTNIDAPADQVWHVHITRTKGSFPPNTFTVATGPTSADWIFHSRNLALGEYTFDIPAMPAGNYLFYCTIDPEGMHGTVTVR